MYQDPSGIYVLSREPLEILRYIDAPNSYAARFSSDSQSIIAVSLGLSYKRLGVQDGQILESKELPIADGCVDAQISPDGALLSCFLPDFSLGVLELSTGRWIFSEQFHTSIPRLTIVPIPHSLDSPFPGPFGFTLAHDLEPVANLPSYGLPMIFSPDGSTLVAGDVHDAVRVDTVERKKIKLPRAIQKYLSGGTVAIQNDTRALVISRGKAGEPRIRSLRNGAVLAIPNFKADSACLATDSRFALLSDAQSVRIFDLESDRPVETPENIAVDVFNGEIALAAENGDLLLYRLGENQPLASVFLPLEGMPVLRAAWVSPALDKLALAVDGRGGLFQVSNGQRILSVHQFSAVDFADDATAFLLLPQEPRISRAPVPEYVIARVDAQGAVHAVPRDAEATLATEPQTILQLDAANAKDFIAWTGGKDLLRPGGPVLFEYSFESISGRGMLLPQENGVPWGLLPRAGGIAAGGMPLPPDVAAPFRLRALDPATGKELWSRSFSGLPPIPFANPQGDRLVLSWKARSAGAAVALRRSVAQEAAKKLKLTDQDSFLEALDARTGKSMGGVLVPRDGGPANFDSIFSVGEVIISSTDAVRVHVYSMRDGQLKGKLFGIRPSANGQSNLLALDTGPGQVVLYDLNTSAKLDELIFPDSIAYTHFSADGNRLFVLTKHQVAYVLDVSGVRGVSPSVPPQSPR
jgi:hypothetical protein